MRPGCPLAACTACGLALGALLADSLVPCLCLILDRIQGGNFRVFYILIIMWQSTTVAGT